MLKFEISRGSGRPAAWTGFVPTAGLVHSPRSVFERAIPLTGRVGSEPPTSARTAASGASRDDRRGVSLEVAMVFQPVVSSDPVRGATVSGRRHRQPAPSPARRNLAVLGSTQSPFHPDFRRIPPEAGELVVHCLKARNLRLQRNVHPSPKVVLTAIPDGEEVETSTPTRGPSDRHPVWCQVSGYYKQLQPRLRDLLFEVSTRRYCLWISHVWQSRRYWLDIQLQQAANLETATRVGESSGVRSVHCQ